MVLRHYSSTKIDQLRPQSYLQFKSHKPTGLWVSAEDIEDSRTWLEFCLYEEFGLGYLRFVHEVRLTTQANILRISSGDALKAFTTEYGIPTPYEFINEIDWQRVSERYQGILIAPYFYAAEWNWKEPGVMWYAAWDCASGCIWDLSVIAEVSFCGEINLDKNRELV